MYVVNNQPISPEVLAHYGVLGMKWGVRKDGKPQGLQYGKAGRKQAAKRKVKVSSDYAKTAKLRGKDPRSLSNEEMRSLNERMGLETRYSKLIKQTTDVGKGKKTTKKLIGRIEDQAINAVAMAVVGAGAGIAREMWKNRS